MKICDGEEPMLPGELLLERQLHALRVSEQRLRTTAEQLQLVTDALPALVSYVGRDQRYRFANLAYETWFGRKQSEFLGMHLRDSLGAPGYAQLSPHVELALSGKLAKFRDQITYARRACLHLRQ